MKTLIQNVTIFDGEQVLPQPGGVLFDETGILQVGRTEGRADRVVDGTGRTLTPGLMDGHVHLGSDGLVPVDTPKAYIRTGARIAAQAQEVWRWGITTLCNCGTGADGDIIVRDMICQGTIPGARIVACGRGISITGGHGWPMNHQCDDETEALRAARVQLRQGAGLVKLFATGGMATKGSVPNAPQLTEGQMAVAAEAARQVGALSRAHATGLEGAQRAIRAGVRIIDHAQLDEATARLMLEHGASYCPTIVTRYNILHSQDPKYQFMRAKADPGDLDRKKRALALCRELGIPILAGTDSGPGTLTPLGSSLWTELGIYVEYGLTPVEALTAATGGAAKALGLEGITGRIAPGLCADLALFEGDPTQDIAVLDTLSMTFQGGIPVWVRQ